MLYKKILFTIILIIFSAFSQLKVSEVMRNPVGYESESPGGRSHEYIEIINLGDSTINITGMRIFDGVIFNEIIEVPKHSISQGIQGTKELKHGQVGLIIDKDIFPIYDEFPLYIPDSVVIFTVNSTSICGGLAADDGFIILDERNDTVAVFMNAVDDGKIRCVVEGNEYDGYSVVRNFEEYDTDKWHFEPQSIGKVGLVNTNTENVVTKRFSVELSKKKFTPNGDGIDDDLIISVKKPDLGSVEIVIYSMEGLIIKTFSSDTQTEFTWDGRILSGRLVERGPVFVVGTFTNNNIILTDRKNAVAWYN